MQNEIVNPGLLFLTIHWFQLFILQAAFKLSLIIAFLFHSQSQRWIKTSNKYVKQY